jgi:hypothetical protein
MATRNEVWRVAMLEAVAAVTLIEALARSYLLRPYPAAQSQKNQSSASEQQINNEYDQRNTADTDAAAIPHRR